MGEIRKHRPNTAPADCYTVTEFCARNRISRKLYYVLRKQYLGPLEMHFRGKTLISKEAAEAWRARHTETRQAP